MINAINSLSVCILPIIICTILIYALIKKTPAYENFVDGAKEGFTIAIKIIPYLVAIMVCTAMLKASGAIEIIEKLLSPILTTLKIPVETTIIMITRSLSGSATLGVLADIINQTGAD